MTVSADHSRGANAELRAWLDLVFDGDAWQEMEFAQSVDFRTGLPCPAPSALFADPAISVVDGDRARARAAALRAFVLRQSILAFWYFGHLASAPVGTGDGVPFAWDGKVREQPGPGFAVDISIFANFTVCLLLDFSSGAWSSGVAVGRHWPDAFSDAMEKARLGRGRIEDGEAARLQARIEGARITAAPRSVEESMILHLEHRIDRSEHAGPAWKSILHGVCFFPGTDISGAPVEHVVALKNGHETTPHRDRLPWALARWIASPRGDA